MAPKGPIGLGWRGCGEGTSKGRGWKEPPSPFTPASSPPNGHSTVQPCWMEKTGVCSPARLLLLPQDCPGDFPSHTLTGLLGWGWGGRPPPSPKEAFFRCASECSKTAAAEWANRIQAWAQAHSPPRSLTRFCLCALWGPWEQGRWRPGLSSSAALPPPPPCAAAQQKYQDLRGPKPKSSAGTTGPDLKLCPSPAKRPEPLSAGPCGIRPHP